MKNVWVTDCHKCGGKGTVVTGRTSSSTVMAECVACELNWPYADYVADYKTTKGGLGPYPTAVSIPDYLLQIDAKYPGSEEFKNELMDAFTDVENRTRAEMAKEHLQQCVAFVQHNHPTDALREIMSYLEREAYRTEDELGAS